MHQETNSYFANLREITLPAIGLMEKYNNILKKAEIIRLTVLLEDGYKSTEEDINYMKKLCERVARRLSRVK